MHVKSQSACSKFAVGYKAGGCPDWWGRHCECSCLLKMGATSTGGTRPHYHFIFDPSSFSTDGGKVSPVSVQGSLRLSLEVRLPIELSTPQPRVAAKGKYMYVPLFCWLPKLI